MRAGRMNSDATEVSYRACLNRHADVVGNRDPRYVGRADVKRTLAHWAHPNTQRKITRLSRLPLAAWSIRTASSSVSR
jgi:hypothetical protein